MYAFSAMKQPCFECDATPTKKVGALYLCADHAQTIHDGLAPRHIDLTPEPPTVVTPKPTRQPQWSPVPEAPKPARKREAKVFVIDGRPKCLIEGCESSALVRGLCDPHRKNHSKTGTLDQVALPSKLMRSPVESRQIDMTRTTCVAVGCERAQFRWLCVACYKKASQRGFLSELALPARKPGPAGRNRKTVTIEGRPNCTTDGCKSSAVKVGKCAACYALSRRVIVQRVLMSKWAMTQEAINLNKTGCVAVGCERPRKKGRSGLCGMHYGMAYRKGVLSSLELPRYQKMQPNPSQKEKS